MNAKCIVPISNFAESKIDLLSAFFKTEEFTPNVSYVDKILQSPPTDWHSYYDNPAYS